MLFASIDIGSNAVRLLFSNIFEDENGILSEKATIVRIPLRLGIDVFNTSEISETKVNDLLKTLQAFKLLIEVYKPIDYCICATAAMREANNSKDVCKQIKENTGFDVKIIDGLEEANIVCAFDNFKIPIDKSISMYIDVGGGSTEISFINEHKIIGSNSFRIGTIRMLNNKIEEQEWTRLNTWLKEYSIYFGKIFCIGSGGNINKINKVYGKKPSNILSLKKIEEAHHDLSKYSLKERIEVLGMRPDRADVIVPASEIFIKIMKLAKIKRIHVPKVGLADAMVILLYKEYKKKIKSS